MTTRSRQPRPRQTTGRGSGFSCRGLLVGTFAGRRWLDGPVVERVGIDLQPAADVISGIEAYGDRYLQRLFTSRELDHLGLDQNPLPAVAERLAGRFAAKEALIKALGVGIDPPSWLEIETLTDLGGAPRLVLTGRAEAIARELDIDRFSLSISHADGLAVAIVIATQGLTHPAP